MKSDKISHLLRLRRLQLAIAASLALTAAGAQAAPSWVSTHTDAFVHGVLNTPAANNLRLAQYQRNLSAASAGAKAVDANQTVEIAVSLNLRNEDELDRFVSLVNQPGSPVYHQYLSTDEVRALYAPTEQQVKAVVDHLQAAGFTQIEVASNRLLITAKGTAGAVKTAFNTGLQHFTFNQRDVYTNDQPAQVPTELGGIVNAVLGLQNVATPHILARQAPAVTSATEASAQSVGTQASGGSEVGHSPTEFATIYHAGSTPTASKTVVGIISAGKLDQTITDLASFTSAKKLSTVNTAIVKTAAASSSGYSTANGTTEWDLDSQDIVGVSGGVKQLVFYDAPDLSYSHVTAAYNRAVADNRAKIINVSLGSDEASTHSSGVQSADDKVFKVAVAQGQTFSVSSGDEGVYESTDGLIPSDPSDYTVSEPAASPYVIAVGGTAVYTTGATTYAKETVWNNGLDSDGYLGATGGGTSLYETAPSWQKSSLGSAVTKRVLPDVAFVGDPYSGAKIYVSGEIQQWGGTSLSAPLFAGIWARLQSANDNGLGFPAASIYKYFPKNPTLLHDVTSGNNGYNGYGYSAKAGWDHTTGWGSVDISALNTFVKATSDFAR